MKNRNWNGIRIKPERFALLIGDGKINNDIKKPEEKIVKIQVREETYHEKEMDDINHCFCSCFGRMQQCKRTGRDTYRYAKRYADGNCCHRANSGAVK